MLTLRYGSTEICDINYEYNTAAIFPFLNTTVVLIKWKVLHSNVFGLPWDTATCVSEGNVTAPGCGHTMDTWALPLGSHWKRHRAENEHQVKTIAPLEIWESPL